MRTDEAAVRLQKKQCACSLWCETEEQDDAPQELPELATRLEACRMALEQLEHVSWRDPMPFEARRHCLLRANEVRLLDIPHRRSRGERGEGGQDKAQHNDRQHRRGLRGSSYSDGAVTADDQADELLLQAAGEELLILKIGLSASMRIGPPV
jgi:hypothetical protein